MSTEADLHVAEFLCSRLCHDLIGPVGAINNGLELMAEMGVGDGDDAVDLVRSSGKSAADRLQFFRLAFGAAGRSAANLSFAEAAKSVQLLATSRVTIAWDAAHQPASPPPGDGAVKLLLNMVLLACEALASGGTVRIAITPSGGGFAAEITSEPSRGVARLHEEATAALAADFRPAGLGARAVLAYYTRLLADEIAGGMSVRTSDGRLTLAATLPSGQ